MKKILTLLLLAALVVPTTGQMKMSPVGLKMVKHFEGFRGKAYLCPASVWTIGFGSTGLGVKPGMTITERQGEILLLKDLVRFENYVNKTIYRLMKWHEFDALTSFTFNVGYRIKDEFRTAVNTGNTKVVVYKLSLYSKAKMNGRYVVLPGLATRRRAESFLYEYGQSLIK